jgi:hypothetical protein
VQLFAAACAANNRYAREYLALCAAWQLFALTDAEGNFRFCDFLLRTPRAFENRESDLEGA